MPITVSIRQPTTSLLHVAIQAEITERGPLTKERVLELADQIDRYTLANIIGSKGGRYFRIEFEDGSRMDFETNGQGLERGVLRIRTLEDTKNGGPSSL